MAVPIFLRGLAQLFNLSLGQVLSAAQLFVRLPSRGNCSFFGGWRDQLRMPKTSRTEFTFDANSLIDTEGRGRGSSGGIVMQLNRNQQNSQITQRRPLKQRFAGKTFFGAALSAATITIATLGMSLPVEALPSFARQTGQPCGACHTDFPSLTPFGRQFKLGGYTLGGGKFRTTLFPSQDDGTKASAKVSMPTKAPSEKAASGSIATEMGCPRHVRFPPLATG